VLTSTGQIQNTTGKITEKVTDCELKVFCTFC